ncbi:DUF4436 family protein [Kitasatospora sp. NPDC058063]|uniref:DUF4436 family protein n=1 Tax=unclassified Kitasatospora TaxID=2633591 RepID=UPI0036DB1CEC
MVWPALGWMAATLFALVGMRNAAGRAADRLHRVLLGRGDHRDRRAPHPPRTVPHRTAPHRTVPVGARTARKRTLIDSLKSSRLAFRQQLFEHRIRTCMPDGRSGPGTRIPLSNPPIPLRCLQFRTFPT